MGNNEINDVQEKYYLVELFGANPNSQSSKAKISLHP